MWKRTSSAIDSSKRSRWSRAAASERRRLNISHLIGSRVERGSHGGGETFPAVGFFPKALSSSRSHRVVLRFPAVLALSPFGGDQPLMLQPIERGIERALRNLQRVVGHLLDPQEYAVAVERLQRHRFQDQHVERAREQIGAFGH